jgi:hypothetical protein
VLAGFDQLRFWELTPKQILIDVEGAAEQQRRLGNERIAQAWHTAVFTRQKKLSRLKSVLNHGKGESKPKQDWQEQMSAMETWMAMRRANKGA